MELILLLLVIWIGLIGSFVFSRLGRTEKQRVKKQLVRELRYSGKLRKELDALQIEYSLKPSDRLHRKLNLKNRELIASKDRCVKLVQRFVQLQTKGQNAKCSE